MTLKPSLFSLGSLGHCLHFSPNFVSRRHNILHSPIIWPGAQDPLPQRRPTDMENFSEVSGKDLQGLLRTCGQVVHPHIFVLTACCYHVPGKTETEGWAGHIQTPHIVVYWGLTCCSGSSHSQIQQQGVCTCGGFYHPRFGWHCHQKNITYLTGVFNKQNKINIKMRTYQNPSPLQVAILFESLWLHDIQNIPFLPCWRETTTL